MNGKKLFLSSVLGVSVLSMGIVSCNWQIPERVSIKAATELSVPLGTADLDLNDYLGMEKIIMTIREGLGGTADVYDFSRIEGDDTLTYLVRYPMYQIPFDIGGFLGDMNVTDMLKDVGSGFNFEQEVAVPDLSLPAVEIKQNVQEMITQMIGLKKEAVSGIEVQIPEGSKTAVSFTGDSGIKVNTGNSYSKGIKYSPGSAIVVTVTKKDSLLVSSGFTVNLKASIPSISEGKYSYNGSSSKVVDVTKGATFEIPLDNGILPSKFPIIFEGTYKGGSSASLHDYEISFEVKDGINVDAIYEIITHPTDGSPAIDIGDIEIPSSQVSLDSIPSQLIEACLGDASLAITAEMPEGWSGVKMNLKSLSLSGLGAGYNEGDFVDGPSSGYLLNKKLDLSGNWISSGTTIDVSGKISIDVDGATVDLSSCPELAAGVALDVKSLSKIALDMSDIGKNISDSTISFPEGINKYLKKVEFGEKDGSGKWKKRLSDGTYVDCEGLGIKCKLINSLPVGSDIPVTIESVGLGITGADIIKTVISGTGSEESSQISMVSHPALSLDHGVIDFNVKFGGDYTDQKGGTHTNVATLADIVPGTTYTMKLSDAELVCDWSAAKVDMSGVTIRNQVELENIDLSSMLAEMPLSVEDINKIKFNSLNTYFFAQKPSESSPIASKLGDVAIAGDIKLSYKRAGESEFTDNYLLENDGTAVKFVDAITWPANDTMDQINSKTYPEIIDALEASKASMHIDLAPLINDLPTDMHMEYNLKLTNAAGTSDLDVYPYDLVAGDPFSVGIDLVIEFPLSLTLEGEIAMNLMDYVRQQDGGAVYDESNPPPDLLGREGKADFEKFAKYADSIDFFKLKYEVHNDVIPGFKGSIEIRDDLVSTASQVVTECEFERGQQEAGLTGAQIKSILTSYPFNPDVIIKFGSSEEPTLLNLSRAGLAKKDSLGAKVIVDFKMNPDVPIEVWQKEGFNPEGGN